MVLSEALCGFRPAPRSIRCVSSSRHRALAIVRWATLALIGQCRAKFVGRSLSLRALVGLFWSGLSSPEE